MFENRCSQTIYQSINKKRSYASKTEGAAMNRLQFPPLFFNDKPFVYKWAKMFKTCTKESKVFLLFCEIGICIYLF